MNFYSCAVLRPGLFCLCRLLEGVGTMQNERLHRLIERVGQPLGVVGQVQQPLGGDEDGESLANTGLIKSSSCTV